MKKELNELIAEYKKEAERMKIRERAFAKKQQYITAENYYTKRFQLLSIIEDLKEIGVSNCD